MKKYPLIITACLMCVALLAGCNTDRVQQSESVESIESAVSAEASESTTSEEPSEEESTTGHIYDDTLVCEVISNSDSTLSGSFMGGDAALMTKMLQELDYRKENLCRCLPEYTVKTKYGSYGISLNQSYARCDKGQAELSDEQLKFAEEVINKAMEAAAEGSTAESEDTTADDVSVTEVTFVCPPDKAFH